MVDVFNRAGRTILEDCTCFRTDHDCRLRFGIALWTQGSGVRLLCGDDAVGDPAYFMVHPRYGDFLPRHPASGLPAVDFGHRGWSSRLWSAALVPSICFRCASAYYGDWDSLHAVLRGTLISWRTEVTVSGSPQRV